jgi:hypothetical protein
MMTPREVARAKIPFVTGSIPETLAGIVLSTICVNEIDAKMPLQWLFCLSTIRERRTTAAAENSTIQSTEPIV